MQVGYSSASSPSPETLYQVGLTIESANDFKLVNQNPSGRD